ILNPANEANTASGPPPVVRCQGSSESDSTGLAHCNLITTGCQTGVFPIEILVGNYHSYPNGFSVQITGGGGSVLNIVSGNNQTLQPGQTSVPLIAQVTDACGAVSVGTAVTWTVTSGSATIVNSRLTSDATGQ